MGKQRDLIDAEEARQDADIICHTCSNVALEGQRYCWHCKTYWEAVQNGLFDDAYYQE